MNKYIPKVAKNQFAKTRLLNLWNTPKYSLGATPVPIAPQTLGLGLLLHKRQGK